MNREEKGGGVGGNLDQVREGGRESCKLYCEEAFKQRRACEAKEGANILKSEKTQKGNAQQQELRSTGLTDERKSLYSDTPGCVSNVGTDSWT